MCARKLAVKPAYPVFIHTVRKAMHTVYSYGTVMLAIIITVILTLSQSTELEQRQNLVLVGFSRDKKGHKYFGGLACTNHICTPKA